MLVLRHETIVGKIICQYVIQSSKLIAFTIHNTDFEFKHFLDSVHLFLIGNKEIELEKLVIECLYSGYDPSEIITFAIKYNYKINLEIGSDTSDPVTLAQSLVRFGFHSWIPKLEPNCKQFLNKSGLLTCAIASESIKTVIWCLEIGCTEIEFAILKGGSRNDEFILEVLKAVKNEINPSNCHKNGVNVGMWLARNGCVKALKYLIEEIGYKMDISDYDGFNIMDHGLWAYVDQDTETINQMFTYLTPIMEKYNQLNSKDLF